MPKKKPIHTLRKIRRSLMIKKVDDALDFNDTFDDLQDMFRRFLHDEAIGGKLLVLGAILAIAIWNSPWQAAYAHFWETPLLISIGGHGLELDLQHWINEGLMTIFFLVVGFEIKKEIVRGALKNPRIAILPVGAAIGGMLLPALIYVLFNLGQDTLGGWGIPTATDIAFAVAVISLLGRHVPAILKLMLLTLAIADDIGAIILIAVFYAKDVHPGLIGIGLVLMILMAANRHLLGRSMFMFLLAGMVLWLLFHLGGIHASIAGAVLGLLAPVRKGHSLTNRLERFALPISTFIVLPLFALANAGVPLELSLLQSHSHLFFGIVGGLVLGKVGGVLLASWLLVRFRVAQLPPDIDWRHIMGLGFLAGIGFTVSIFITGLAFDSQAYLDAAKLSVLIGSVVSAGIGAVMFLHRRTYNTEQSDTAAV